MRRDWANQEMWRLSFKTIDHRFETHTCRSGADGPMGTVCLCMAAALADLVLALAMLANFLEARCARMSCGGPVLDPHDAVDDSWVGGCGARERRRPHNEHSGYTVEPSHHVTVIST